MKIHWPKVKIPEGFNDAESYLRHLVYQGAKDRFVDDALTHDFNRHSVERTASYMLMKWASIVTER